MPLVETTFTSHDGLNLIAQQWWIDGPARGTIIIVHGGGEHSGRYVHVRGFFNDHGFHVVTFDLRGHGRSEGKRLFVRSFNDYLLDLSAVYTSVREKQPNLPLFLLGHSLGGAISTSYILKYPFHFDGLILSGPLLLAGDGFSPLKIAVAKLVGKVLPSLPVAKLDANLVSSDPAVVKAYVDDPLNHHKGIPAGTGVATLAAFKRIEEQASTIEKPFLIVHGSADQIADAGGSQYLYKHASSTDKTLKLYDGFYHEVMNEPGKDQVLDDILKWLEERSHKD